MTVEFDATGTKNIKWTAPALAIGNIAKTIDIGFYPLASATGWTLTTIFDGTGADSDEYNYLAGVTTDKVEFFAHFSTTNGIWRTTNSVLTANAFNRIIVTYDGSNVANNATIYINGVSVAVTTLATPVGTYRSGISTDLYVSTPLALTPNGRIHHCNYYNRILTASEVEENYASKLAIPPRGRESLVFAPQLHSRGEVGEGGTLTASHTIADFVSGALGTPSGSPLHRGDTVLTFQN